MKKLTLITVITLALASYSPSAANSAEQAPVEEPYHSSWFINYLIDNAASEAAQVRASAISQRITQLEKHVDKTWYAFSGSTPAGWDCSGLVKWFYLDLDVELEHSATAQKYSGEIVTEPMPGDIVGFSHNGSDRVYHNGLYIGNDLFIHSPRAGRQTKVSSVSDYIGEHSTAEFTRVDF